MTRRYVGLTGVLVSLVSLVGLAGCPKPKTDAAEAGADAAHAAVTPVPVAPTADLATNAADIARFPGEVAIANVKATLWWPQTKVRKVPPSGEVIATLQKGVVVTQIASNDKYILVTFDNPNAPATQLMGWVLKDVFAAPLPPAPLKCAADQVILIADVPFCGKVCTTDQECVVPQRCTGTSQLALANGKPGGNVRNCMALATNDAGAAKVDASAPVAIVDAAAPAVADAAPPPAVPVIVPGVIVAPTGPRACAPDFMFVDVDNLCHHRCSAGTGAAVCKNQRCSQQGYCK